MILSIAVIDVILMILYLEQTEIVHTDIHSFYGIIPQKCRFVNKTDEKDTFSVLKMIKRYYIIEP